MRCARGWRPAQTRAASRLAVPRLWPATGSCAQRGAGRIVGRVQQYSETFSTGRYARGGINRQQFEPGEALARCLQAHRDRLKLLPMIHSERQQGARPAPAVVAQCRWFSRESSRSAWCALPLVR